MVFKPGQKVTIVRNLGEKSRYSSREYYFGGDIDMVRLGSMGVVDTVEKDRVSLKLDNGRFWTVDLDEIKKIEGGIDEEDFLLGLKELPKHPVFEIAENTPVFLINGKAYSLGERIVKGKKNFYEDKSNQVARTSLVEIGDFNSLEAITLDRAQLGIEKIGEKYAREIQKELHSLRRVEDSLDVPQLIVKYVFPHLRNGNYDEKVLGLLELESKKNTPAILQVNERNRQNLEKIAVEVVTETEKLIQEIERGQEPEPVKRTKKQSKLDILFDYKEPEENTQESLLGKTLEGRNIAIVDGIVYDLNAGGDESGKQVKVGDKTFYLSARKIMKNEVKDGFGVGDKIRMNKDAKVYLSTKEGSEGEVLSISPGNRIYVIKFTKLTGEPMEVPRNYEVYREHMENITERRVEEDFEKTKDLENKFLTELDKKVRVDALRKHFSKDKVLDLLSTQDAELLEIAGKEQYHEDGFGFVKFHGRYYVYLDVPKFIIKSHLDGNYYLFNETKLGIGVSGNKNRLELPAIGRDHGLIMLKNDRHPLTEGNSDYQVVCIGYNPLPTDGRDNGEVIAKRLKKGKEIVMYGYVEGIKVYHHRQLGRCETCGVQHYIDKKISEQKAKDSGLLIADGERIK